VMSIVGDLPRVEWLRTFLVFAEYLNFTHAARARGLSQPALHGQVKQLEESLGVVLYQRKGRRLELTDNGERVRDYAAELLTSVTGFVEELRGEGDARPVTLSAGEGAYLYLLGPGIEAFRMTEPDRPLRLLTHNREDALEAVQTGKADLAVVASPEPVVGPGIETELLAVVGMAVALPGRHALAASEGPVSLHLLSEESLIAPPRGRPLRRSLEARFAELVDMAAPVALEASGWPLMLEFVRLGLGVAVVNGCCKPPDGVVLRPIDDLPPVNYWLAWRRRSTPGQPPGTALRGVLMESLH